MAYYASPSKNNHILLCAPVSETIACHANVAPPWKHFLREQADRNAVLYGFFVLEVRVLLMSAALRMKRNDFWGSCEKSRIKHLTNHERYAILLLQSSNE